MNLSATMLPPIAMKMKPTALLTMFAATLASGAASAAATVIDLGPASGYSAFIFGNVGSAAASGFHDVEGRLAAGGDVYLGAFSVGVKSSAGAGAPSIVAGGSLNITSGAINNGSAGGTAVYGVSNPSASLNVNQWFQPGTFSKGSAATLDFTAARQQLTTLSNTVSQWQSTGTVVYENTGYTLTGNLNADVNVFNINSSNLQNLTLNTASLKSGSYIIINDSATSINLSGGYSSFAAYAERTLFNFSAATSTSVTTYAWGSILAPQAAFSGTGHLEGTLVANSVTAATQWGSQVEIGAKAFVPVTVLSAVPEPGSYAMLLAGLGLFGLLGMVRRRA